jgi:hypothetical protein
LGLRRKSGEIGVAVVTDGMVADSRVVIQCLEVARPVDAKILSYLGLLMGARLVIPVSVGVGEHLRCAVFAKFGLQVADVHF